MTAISAGRVRRAAETSLQTRLGSYLTAQALATGIDLPPIVSWRRQQDFRRTDLQWDTPALITTTPIGSTLGEPVRSERGGWRLRFLVRPVIVAKGRSIEETSDRVSEYLAAVRSCMADDPTLSGLAVAAEWIDERQFPLPPDQERTVQAGQVTWAYEVETNQPAPMTVTATDLTATPLPSARSFLPVHPAL